MGRATKFIIDELTRRAKGGDELAQGGINAWHGSPHDFDQFKLSQIGTGEGAQAYGHGLYFAEKKGIAESYRDTLATRAIDNTTGIEHNEAVDKVVKAIGGNEDDWLAVDTILNNAAEFDQSAAQAAAQFSDNPDIARAAKMIADNPSASKDAESYLNFLKSSDGSLYNVNIDATPDELLDWDKPLSEQPSDMREKVKGVFTEFGLADPTDGGRSMNALMYDLGHEKSAGSPAKASEALRSAGIKGIQYNDAMSRGAEGGTKNYVIFDDKLIDIAKKYGVALPVAAQMMQTEDAQAGVVSKTAGKLSDLAMDTASRMARAKEQGFDVDETLYHGTSGLDELKAFDKSQTGKGADQFGPGFYLTTSPHQASGYAQDIARGQGTIKGDSKGVIQAKTGGNLLDIDGTTSRGMAEAIELDSGQIKEMLLKSDALKRSPDGDDMNPLGDYYDSFWDGGAEEWMLDDLAEKYAGRNPEELTDLFDDNDKFLSALSEATGYDGIRVNWPDVSHEVHWKPENIRSVNAAFDPAQRESSNLLASTIPAAVGLGALAGGALYTPEQNRAMASTAERLGVPLQTTDRMMPEEYPQLESIADFIEQYTPPTPLDPLLGTPTEGLTNYLRNFGKAGKTTGDRAMDAFGAALDVSPF